MKISGNESVVGQIRSTRDGGTGVELAFPERMVLIANHQVCRNLHLTLKQSYFGVSADWSYYVSYIQTGCTSGGAHIRRLPALTAISSSS